MLIFGALCFSYSFISFYKSINNYEADKNQEFQGIAVLTGGKGRIAKGIKLFKENPSRYLLISGVDKSTKKIDVLPEELLESDNLFIDKKSETTLDNAEEIIKWSYENSIRDIKIITSDYHMPRSLLLLSKKSKDLNFYADPVISDINIKKDIFSDFKLVVFLLEEYLKYLFYYLVL